MASSIGLAPDGLQCWDSRQCGLCKHFLDARIVLELFTHRYICAAKVSYLEKWMAEGRGQCELCKYVYRDFVHSMDGEPLLSSADLVIRWETQSRQGEVPDINGITFEMAWGFPNR